MFCSQHSDVATQPNHKERYEVVLFCGRGNLGCYDPALILDRKLLDDDDVLNAMYRFLREIKTTVVEIIRVVHGNATLLLVEGIERKTFERCFSQAIVATREQDQMPAIAETVYWWQDYQFVLNELAAEFPQCKPMAQEFDAYPHKGEPDEWVFIWFLKKIFNLRNNEINLAVYNHRNMLTALVNFTTCITFAPKTDMERQHNDKTIITLLCEDAELYETLGGENIAGKLRRFRDIDCISLFTLVA